MSKMTDEQLKTLAEANGSQGGVLVKELVERVLALEAKSGIDPDLMLHGVVTSGMDSALFQFDEASLTKMQAAEQPIFYFTVDDEALSHYDGSLRQAILQSLKGVWPVIRMGSVETADGYLPAYGVAYLGCGLTNESGLQGIDPENGYCTLYWCG